MSLSVPRAIDAWVLLDGARAALLANSTVAGFVGTRIYPGVAQEGTAAPYIVLALASTIYESPYQDPTLNTLLDVSAYTSGGSTTTVRTLITACITALVDTPWTAAGLAIQSANMEEAGTGFREVDTVDSGVMTRGRQLTLRVRAAKT
jgi:hypothetical protein